MKLWAKSCVVPSNCERFQFRSIFRLLDPCVDAQILTTGGQEIDDRAVDDELPYDLPFSTSLSKHYAKILRQEKLINEQIILLTPRDLKDLGIPFGDALLILKHLRQVNLHGDSSSNLSPTVILNHSKMDSTSIQL